MKPGEADRRPEPDVTEPLTRAAREAASGHRGAVVWLTGLPGAGKTTVARGVERALVARRARALVLDGDVVRGGLCADLGFSAADRAENVRRIGEVAALVAASGSIALVACIAPFRDDRRRLAERLGDDWLEVWVAAPAAVCEARDPKGLWRRARAGALPEFTGVDAPYEAPATPALTLATHEEPVAASVARVLGLLEARGVLPA